MQEPQNPGPQGKRSHSESCVGTSAPTRRAPCRQNNPPASSQNTRPPAAWGAIPTPMHRPHCHTPVPEQTERCPERTQCSMFNPWQSLSCPLGSREPVPLMHSPGASRCRGVGQTCPACVRPAGRHTAREGASQTWETAGEEGQASTWPCSEGHR